MPLDHHVDPPAPGGDGAPDLSRRGVGLLSQGVPVSLLMDLADPQGPRSREVFEVEGGSAAWL